MTMTHSIQESGLGLQTTDAVEIAAASKLAIEVCNALSLNQLLFI